MARGQVPGHVVAQVLGWGDGEALGPRQAAVGGPQAVVGHAQPGVDDRQCVGAAAQGVVPVEAAPDVDALVGRREDQRVLHQLGQQVGQVGRGRPQDGGGLDVAHADPVVVLDLAQRGPDHVRQPHRRGPLAGRVEAGQHQQRLGVAAHAGGQVVEPEQVGEGVGVRLVALQLGDEVELAAEQVLVAPAEVDEAVGDVAAQHGLLDGQVQGGVLHGVERGGHVGHLVPGLDGHGRDVGHGHVLARRGVEDVVDRLGQPVLGHLGRLSGQRAQRLGDRSRHQPGQHQGGAQRDHGQPHVEPLAPRGHGVQLVGPVVEPDRQGVAEAHVPLVDRHVEAVEHQVEVDLAASQGGVHVLPEPVDQLLGEVRAHDVGERRLGQHELLVGAVELGLELVRCRDLAGLVDPVAEAGVHHHPAGQVAERLDLLGGPADQRGPLPQLGVVDRQGHPVGGLEEGLDQLGVAGVHVVGERDLLHATGSGVAVDGGTDGGQVGQVVERGLDARA